LDPLSNYATCRYCVGIGGDYPTHTYYLPVGLLLHISMTAVRSGAEIGLPSLRLSVSQGASLGDFLLAPACSIVKVTLWEGFLYLTSGSETDEGVAKDKGFARAGNRIRASETQQRPNFKSQKNLYLVLFNGPPKPEACCNGKIYDKCWELLLTTGDPRDRDLNRGSHACMPSA